MKCATEAARPQSQVEREIAAMAQPILDRRAEQPERPHVENEVQPAAVQEHHGEERQEVGGDQGGVAIDQGLEIAGGDESEGAQELLELDWTEAVLEQEHDAIGGNQHPGDHRRIAGRDGVSDRDHVRLRFSDWARISDRIRRCVASGCA